MRTAREILSDLRRIQEGAESREEAVALALVLIGDAMTEAHSGGVRDGLKTAMKLVHDMSRGTKSEERAIAIDEARDLIFDEITNQIAGPNSSLAKPKFPA